MTGFIVYSTTDYGIYGYGDTETAAMNDAAQTFKAANIAIVSNDDEIEKHQNIGASYTLRSNLRTMLASAALIKKVQDEGGTIAWHVIDGVAVTHSLSENAD